MKDIAQYTPADQLHFLPRQYSLFEFENYNLLDPEIGIMLNEFFISGKLYLPGEKKPIKAPKNLLIGINSCIQDDIDLTPAEQSRHVRLCLYDYPFEEMELKIKETLCAFGGFKNETKELNEAVNDIFTWWKFFNNEPFITSTASDKYDKLTE